MANAYQNWKFRADIDITNPSSIEGFQASLSLSWLPGMRGDFRDIRFASLSGIPIPYWIESETDFSSATVWIKLPANDMKIRLYYGNGVAVSESSASDVFDFYNDGSSLSDFSTSGSPTVSNDQIYMNAGDEIYYTFPASFGMVVEWRSKSTGSSSDEYFNAQVFSENGLSPSSNSLAMINFGRAGSKISYYSGGYYDIGTYSPDIYAEYKVEIPTGTNQYAFYKNGSCLKFDIPYRTNDGSPTSIGFLESASVPNPSYIDYIRVRKYEATEPTLILSRKQPNPDFQSFGFLFSTGPETSFTLPCTGISLGPAAPRMVGDFPVPPITGISIGPASKTIQEALILPCSGLTLQGGYTPLRDTIALPCSGIDLSLDPYGFREYADLSAYGVKRIEIARSINDSMWTMNIETAGEASVSEFMHVFYDAEDAAGNSYHVFSGIVPTTSKKYACAGYSNQQTAYDYGYYLSRQYLPLDCLVMNLDGEYTSWDQWISKLLDETGIRKYKIITCEEANSEFIFTNTTTKLDAIKEICEYTGFLFYVGWINGGTEDDPVWEPAAWFVNEADIDDSINGLDLPNPVTITWPAGDLVDLPRVETPSDEKINRVRVRGTDGNGNWYSATLETPAVTNGRHMPVEYLEYPSPYATTETGALARATALYNYFTANVATVEATFIRRPDLQLWQKIQFSGSEFPDVVTGMGWLRIISIRYSFSDADETVTITAVQDRDNSILLSNTDLLLQDSVSETELIIDSKLDDLLSVEVGTVISIEGDVATVETESGKIIKVRIVS